jgi:NhaC family Na+:H+ antiporter
LDFTKIVRIFAGEMKQVIPHPLVALVPVVVLIGFLAVVIALFGSDSLSGGSQVALLMGMAVCVSISMGFYRVSWRVFEAQIKKTLGEVSITLLILLCVGMLAGSWMISGIVPTLIYYGVQVMSPQFFLVSSCVICALVSLLSGSSWTTIATIGVALLGIGHALGASEAWTAGAIISGAYFGDKMSPLSDTTILASSATGTDLFTHIRYMMLTTVPTFLIAITIFFVTGLGNATSAELHVAEYTEGLSGTFRISLWTLLVPLLTGVLIARRVPSLIVLFASSVMAGVVALLLQPHILTEIATGVRQASDCPLSTVNLTRGLAMTYYGATGVDTGNASLNELVSTGGMAGMLNTIWLILCAMCFGAAMVASGMIESLTQVILRWVKSRVSLVGSTVGTGIFLNITTGDQFISIVLAADMYKEVYREQGYESRLLSRTCEDAATVTSVLVPWNTCGMTQSTVLGVPTLTYLPYCFFNLLSPMMSILVAAIGWRIYRKQQTNHDGTNNEFTESEG